MKESDKDAVDGKKGGILGFKSPFKKKVAYNKHSDESETSSIDSFSFEDKKRGKKDRSSDRSNDSGSHNLDNLSAKLSNGSGRISPFNRQIDTNQLLTDIHNTLAVNINSDGSNKSPSIHSGDVANVYPLDVSQYGATNGSLPHVQIEFIQKMIEDSMEESRLVHYLMGTNFRGY